MMRKVRFRAEETVYEGRVENGEFLVEDDRYDPEAVEVLPPCTPTKIVAAGMNYGEHVENIIDEGFPKPKFPTFFFKPSSSTLAHGKSIVKHEDVDFLDYEGEVAFVIGEECSDVTQSEALEYVEGYTPFNDVSARDWIAREDQWARGKSIDTFSPLGPYLQTELNLPISLTTRVNGDVRQDSDTSDLFFGVRELIAEASRYFTLQPGDVVATGTPPGTAGETVPFEEWDEQVSELALDPGDDIEVSVEGAGRLRNDVV
jgi:2-keto-4-pentenoate hydratase/2-oxohepta-3-ene-1,7-dioic acid hydratase in catechol pathway